MHALELADRLIQAIGSQRHASTDSYPVPQRRLFELAACDGKAINMKAALKEATFVDKVIACHSATTKEPAYILRQALPEMIPVLTARGGRSGWSRPGARSAP